MTRSGSEVAVTPLADWQIFYFRENAWTNAAVQRGQHGQRHSQRRQPRQRRPPRQSTTALPDGVRLVLNLPPGQAISGTLTRDWVRPTAGGTRP